ncbi:hypothetical protein HPB50_016834 [Hyalomma asiaticum]|uniref:Uncharacterized protein n=1 Tax=Hyalomma asiaticum TaxID=266040 RepID=A0ACB7S330_HYAAI|nr:hypothetical protein HPB50_016834 [Hyalomma asiaticum]
MDAKNNLEAGELRLVRTCAVAEQEGQFSHCLDRRERRRFQCFLGAQRQEQADFYLVAEASVTLLPRGLAIRYGLRGHRSSPAHCIALSRASRRHGTFFAGAARSRASSCSWRTGAVCDRRGALRSSSPWNARARCRRRGASLRGGGRGSACAGVAAVASSGGKMEARCPCCSGSGGGASLLR